MTTTALLFFLIAVIVVWGGLVVSILRLRHDTRRDPGDGPHEARGPDL